MITNYYGAEYHGSTSIQTSVSESEIIPSGLTFYNFELINDGDCHISINGSDYIYIRASQGISIDVAKSIKIKEDNIAFNWIGVRG